jgi:hypothetical protein
LPHSHFTNIVNVMTSRGVGINILQTKSKQSLSKMLALFAARIAISGQK